MTMSSFKDWCVSQNFANSSNLSHVLMDGGVLSVPFDRLHDFYDRYVMSVVSGEKIFVVEQKTDIFNFFVDLDYKSNVALTFDEIEDIVTVVCEAVGETCECMVSISKPKEHGDKIKSGIHINWPNFPVDQTNALSLRNKILLDLGGANDWDTIVDQSVYGNPNTKTKGSGFRLPWSYKKGKHGACNGKGCSGCVAGKIIELPYLPVYAYKNGVLNPVESDRPTIDMLFTATVRSQATVSASIPDVGEKRARREGSFTKTQTKNEVKNEHATAQLETFIRLKLPGQADARVTKLFRHEDMYLVSTTSMYCENIGRNHNSNHVWFMITENSVAQKCFCRCETIQGRKGGFCKDFTGVKHNLPPSIRDVLFTNKKSDTIKRAIAPRCLLSLLSSSSSSSRS
jgi:hypothetical protein